MTISDSDFYISDANPYQGHDWVYWRALMAMLPPDSYAPLKEWILQECNLDQTCTTSQSQVQKMTNFESHWRKAFRIPDDESSSSAH